MDGTTEHNQPNTAEQTAPGSGLRRSTRTVGCTTRWPSSFYEPPPPGPVDKKYWSPAPALPPMNAISIKVPEGCNLFSRMTGAPTIPTLQVRPAFVADPRHRRASTGASPQPPPFGTAAAAALAQQTPQPPFGAAASQQTPQPSFGAAASQQAAPPPSFEIAAAAGAVAGTAVVALPTGPTTTMTLPAALQSDLDRRRSQQLMRHATTAANTATPAGISTTTPATTAGNSSTASRALRSTPLTTRRSARTSSSAAAAAAGLSPAGGVRVPRHSETWRAGQAATTMADGSPLPDGFFDGVNLTVLDDYSDDEDDIGSSEEEQGDDSSGGSADDLDDDSQLEMFGLALEQLEEGLAVRSRSKTKRIQAYRAKLDALVHLARDSTASSTRHPDPATAVSRGDEEEEEEDDEEEKQEEDLVTQKVRSTILQAKQSQARNKTHATSSRSSDVNSSTIRVSSP
eukprot:scpid79488/ scgid11588/ 